LHLTPDGFIEIPITAEMIFEASDRAARMGELKNSIRHGEGNIIGFLGEAITLQAFPGAISCPTYEYDILRNNQRLEVKSKDRSVRPELHYEVSVAEYNSTQHADFYIFCSLYRPKEFIVPTVGYVVGYMSPTEFKQRARFLKAGDVDTSNGWECKADCWNLPIEHLHKFKHLP
jgi:hypothetical protein